MLVFNSNAYIRERDNHISHNIKPFANWSSFLPRISAKPKVKVTTSTLSLTPVLECIHADALKADLQPLQRFVFACMEDRSSGVCQEI